MLAAYLIALVNTLAYERKINIEMVHRSSFGCLRPSVAECGESLRINLGLTPRAYVNCVIDAIFYLQQIMTNTDAFSIPFESKSLSNTLSRYNDLHKNKKRIKLHDTLWDTLWAPGDCSNKSFASQFFRKSVVAEYLVDLIQTECLKSKSSILFDGTPSSRKSYKVAFKAAFITPLTVILQSIRLNGESLSINIDDTHLKSFQWQPACKVDDKAFWNLAEHMADCLGVEDRDRQALTTKKITENLHSRFEAWIANFTFQPMADSSVTDGNGSDSEEEKEWNILDETVVIHSKKITTATGMRAIQLSDAVSRNYLHNKYGLDLLSLTFNADQMYYETPEALSKYAIPIESNHKKNKTKGPNNITFFDVNHCNTTHKKMSDMIASIAPNDRICVIDITSSTTKEIHNMLMRIYERRPKIDIILTVSSGLKNEQLMGDYNPYGTVRIFSKDSESLNTIYDDLVAFEEQANYLHPRESHLIRKTAKLAGMTPTNSAILMTKSSARQ